MYLVENPVLQRELLANLRAPRAFLLLLGYVGLLGAVVWLAWPADTRIDLGNPEAARRLVNLFFLSQYALASLIAPSFAAGAISGEKERATYEMLLASPLRPSAIIAGKLLASLAHLVLLIVASLPIAVLCLPLGGTSLYEVLALYAALVLSVLTFGTISLAASSYFRRTFAALVVSYLIILPLAVLGPLAWMGLGQGAGSFRLVVAASLLPIACASVCVPLWGLVARRLLHPPDVGSEGKEVLDEEQELEQAVGLVIQRGRFPDMLFAPAKRTELLDDRANPVFDKELRSEIFSQGTLMLRLVIQASTLLEFPAMFFFLFIMPQLAPWYVSYVLLFNLLVGPVFSAGSITSERERETLELLLTTPLTPWQILWPKLIAGLRVSSVLTMFLLWPVLLAAVMVSGYWSNLPALVTYVVIVLGACLTTSQVALFCAVIFRRTVTCLLAAYLALLLLFAGPPATDAFAQTFLPAAGLAEWIHAGTLLSPFSAAFAVPLDVHAPGLPGRVGAPLVVLTHLGFTVVFNLLLTLAMRWLFQMRWRVAQ